MDCDDVILVLAASVPVLTGLQQAELAEHCEGCATCDALRRDLSAQRHWVAWLPDHAFRDPDAPVLQTVDPVVFDMQEELAHGGMGRVTRARDRRLGRDVAIKEVLAPYLRARFEREVRITARLQHPAIVPIYEAGAWPDGSAFYTMRLVPGHTLADAIGAATTLGERLALLPNIVAVTDALAYAHSHRIVHRDLKPGNVLVGEFGETVVIDWGLAKELDHEVTGDVVEELTRAGAVIGTPGFMPPEQACGEPVDERADVYALGALLYNVLSGRAPYYDHDAITPEIVLATSCLRPPLSLDKLVPDAPAGLRAIVARAMARAPQDRYPTAKELAAALSRHLLGARDSPRAVVARWIRRHRIMAGVLAIAVPALAIAASLAVADLARTRDAEREARLGAEDARRDADRLRESADHDIDALLEELGRGELVAGEPERALAYLASAYTRGRDGIALRHLLAVADRSHRGVARFGGSGTQVAGAYAVIGLAHTIVTRRLDTGEVVRTIENAELVGAVSRDGARALARRDDAAVVLDLQTGVTLAPLPRGARALSRDGRYALAYTPGEPQLVVHEAATGRQVRELAAPACKHAAISPDGALVAAIAGTPPETRVWRASNGSLLASIATPGAVELAFDPTGRRLFVNAGSDPAIFDAQTGRAVASIPRGAGRVTTVRFDDTGRRLATGYDDGSASLWELETGTQLVHAAASSFAVTADGARFATGGADGLIRIWDSDTGRLLELLHGDGAVAGLAWSADGTRLVSETDGQAALWDVHLETRTRAEIGAHAAHAAWIVDGARLRQR